MPDAGRAEGIHLVSSGRATAEACASAGEFFSQPCAAAVHAARERAADDARRRLQHPTTSRSPRQQSIGHRAAGRSTCCAAFFHAPRSPIGVRPGSGNLTDTAAPSPQEFDALPRPSRRSPGLLPTLPAQLPLASYFMLVPWCSAASSACDTTTPGGAWSLIGAARVVYDLDVARRILSLRLGDAHARHRSLTGGLREQDRPIATCARVVVTNPRDGPSGVTLRCTRAGICCALIRRTSMLCFPAGAGAGTSAARVSDSSGSFPPGCLPPRHLCSASAAVCDGCVFHAASGAAACGYLGTLPTHRRTGGFPRAMPPRPAVRDTMESTRRGAARGARVVSLLGSSLHVSHPSMVSPSGARTVYRVCRCFPTCFCWLWSPFPLPPPPARLISVVVFASRADGAWAAEEGAACSLSSTGGGVPPQFFIVSVSVVPLPALAPFRHRSQTI